MKNIVTTSPKGQVVIPVEIRRAIGLESGQKVRVELKEIKPLPKDPIKSLRGKFSSSPSMTQSLLKDRKEDTLREESEAARFLRDSGMASE